MFPHHLSFVRNNFVSRARAARLFANDIYKLCTHGVFYSTPLSLFLSLNFCSCIISYFFLPFLRSQITFFCTRTAHIYMNFAQCKHR